MINMNKNIFTVSMLIEIEKEIHDYVKSTELTIDIDVKKTIYEVMQSLATNPKLYEKELSQQEIQNKIVNIVKKYITKQVELLDKQNTEEYKKKFLELQETRKSLDMKVEHRLDKHIVLDSHKSVVLNSDELKFNFKTPIDVKNINLTYLTIQSDEKIDEPYLYIQSQQLRTNNYTDVTNVLDCAAVLILNKEIRHDDGTFTYHYKNINKHVNNDINQLLTQLNFKFYISMKDTYINMSKAYSVKSHSHESDDSQHIAIEIGDDATIEKFSVGDSVQIIDEDSEKYKGKVESLDSEKNKIVVKVFGHNEEDESRMMKQIQLVEHVTKRCVIYIDHA